MARFAGIPVSGPRFAGTPVEEQITEDPMRQGQPAPEAPPQSLADQLSAGFTAGVEAIPLVGPAALSGLEQLKAKVQGRTPEDVHATDKAQVAQNPVASTVGSVAGNVLPFVAGGEVPVIGRLLGMTGSLPSRIGLGGLSGGIISGADSAVRGNDPMTAVTDGAIGAGVGAAFPVAAKGAGFLRDLFMGRTAPREAQSVARALRDDDVPVDQINQRLTDLGPDAMVMDLGPNLQAQAGAVASVPGPGQRIVRQAVTQRAAGAGGRVADDITATIGNGPEIGALRDRIVQQQSQAADPLYAAVRNVPLSNLPQLAAVARTPMGRRALDEAITAMENDGLTVTRDSFTVGMADYMKRSLDDLASTSARTGNNNVARQARNMTRAITGAVDRAVPGYRTARDAFAGPAQVLDAIELGTTAFTREMSPAQLRRELAAMSAGERDAVLQGAQAQVEAMMGNAVNDVATLRNTFRKGWNEDKLRALLGPDVAADLLRRIDRELAYGNTSGAVVRNSETARRQASQAEVNPTTGTVSQPGKTILGLVFDAFNGARNAIEGVRRPQINAAMANLHTQRQLSPAMIRSLRNGSRASGPGVIAPAGVATMVEQKRSPVQITVHGGR